MLALLDALVEQPALLLPVGSDQRGVAVPTGGREVAGRQEGLEGGVTDPLTGEGKGVGQALDGLAPGVTLALFQAQLGVLAADGQLPGEVADLGDVSGAHRRRGRPRSCGA